jgi:hypothetical protein
VNVDGSGTPPAGWQPARPIELALARVHLRTGALALARAELEALAGRAELDDEALVDLAEARWRTGDLAGAGDAASAYLAGGGAAPIGLVISAEATVAAGRPGEARSIVGRALDAVHGPVEPIFAGMPRSSIWPADIAAPTESGGTALETPGIGAERSAGAAIDPHAELEAARAALHGGRMEVAALHLSLALRFDPALVGDVDALLAGVDAAAGPAIDLVRGDVHRALGRDAEAIRAWTAAAAAAGDVTRRNRGRRSG